jgi:hypothetical protein
MQYITTFTAIAAFSEREQSRSPWIGGNAFIILLCKRLFRVTGKTKEREP